MIDSTRFALSRARSTAITARLRVVVACAFSFAVGACMSLDDFVPADGSISDTTKVRTADDGGMVTRDPGTDVGRRVVDAGPYDAQPTNVDAPDDERGAVDVDGCGLPAPLCDHQFGVCRGQRSPSCEAGVWAPCGTAVYARHPLYEEVEAACELGTSS